MKPITAEGLSYRSVLIRAKLRRSIFLRRIKSHHALSFYRTLPHIVSLVSLDPANLTALSRLCIVDLLTSLQREGGKSGAAVEESVKRRHWINFSKEIVPSVAETRVARARVLEPKNN